MQINITGHQLEITEGLKDHIEKKNKKIKGTFAQYFRN